MNFKWMQKAFKKVCGRYGGEVGIEEIFKTKGARTVSQQAGLVGDLAAGVPVSQLVVSRGKSLGFSVDQLEGSKARLATRLGGKPQLLEYLKSHRAFKIGDQFRVVGEELARREGTAPSPSKPAALPSSKPSSAATAFIRASAPTAAKATSLDRIDRAVFDLLSPAARVEFLRRGGTLQVEKSSEIRHFTKSLATAQRPGSTPKIMNENKLKQTPTDPDALADGRRTVAKLIAERPGTISRQQFETLNNAERAEFFRLGGKLLVEKITE